MKKLKRSNPILRTIFYIVSIIYILGYIYFTVNVINLAGIETVIRYIILILLLAYFIYYIYRSIKRLSKRKYFLYILHTLLTILICILFFFGGIVINYVYNLIGGIHEANTLDYTGYLISLKSTSKNNIKTVGMISDENDIEGYTLANKIIEDNNLDVDIKKYDDYTNMIYDLYKNVIDGAFVSSNYVTLFSNEEAFEDIKDATKKVYSATQKLGNMDLNIKSNKSLNEPFTVLILGVDSEENGLNANAAFNGDTLILVTFNPDTLAATMFSMPRDIFVPITCQKNKPYKINSSAAYGTQCVISTVEKLTDIKIDYYVKINFKGVVDLVNAVGGVDIDVQKADYPIHHGHNCGEAMCEQDSNRSWEKPIYLYPGMQTLNGEEALAYARNRGSYIGGDIARNRHQQEIITALAKKILRLRNYTEFKNILSAISSNVASNMETPQILSSYNVFKNMLGNALNDEEFLYIQRTQLETYPLHVYLESKVTTAALGYYKSSLNEIINAMKTNLGLNKHNVIKTFSYKIGEEYIQEIVGSGKKSGYSYLSLKSFIGQEEDDAKKYCNDNKLKCSFKTISNSDDRYNSKYESGKIISQTPHEDTLMDYVEEVEFLINE